MQHFQTILIAIGILAIAGVLVHGFLLNKKNQLAEEQENEADEKFDDIEGESQEEVMVERELDAIAFSEAFIEEEVEPSKNSDIDMTGQEKEVEIIKSVDDIKLDASLNTTAESSVKEAITKGEQPVKEVPEVKDEHQDLFIFNVVTRDGAQLGGHELLQFFLTSGFRFGARSIFHRHEHADGTGEVLFSIANMMAPGTFDLDSMEQFHSVGISFFLIAPNEKISINESFEMMLRAVEQIAEEFDCDVLNADRELLTKAQFIEYRHRLQQYS